MRIFFTSLLLLLALPAAAQPHVQRVVFGVIGDYGFDRPAIVEVSAMMRSWEPDFIITVGDNNYPFGEAETIDRNIGRHFHDFISPYRGSYGEGADINRFFPSLGNHDWDRMTCGDEECQGAHFDYFDLPGNERYYDFVWGPLHLFALDSDVKEPDGYTADSRQAAWFREQIEASTSCWNVVYFHHAPYTSGTRHGNSTDLQWPFADWGASVVMTGHDHLYERLEHDGIPYFVNGSGGGVLYDLGSPIPQSRVRYNERPGAMHVEATCGEITYRFFNDLREETDRYTIRKPASLSLSPVEASQEGPEVVVNWTATGEINIDRFVLEREDEEGFEPLETYPARGDFDRSVVYADTLRLPVGENQLRVRWIGTGEGEDDLSETVTVEVVPSSVEFEEIVTEQIEVEAVRLSWTTAREVLADSLFVEQITDEGPVVLTVFAAEGRELDGRGGSYDLTLRDLEEGSYIHQIRWTGRDGLGGVSPPDTITVARPAVAFEAVTATQIGTALHVTWTTPTERLIDFFEIDLAEADGPFTRVERLPAEGEPGAYDVPLDGLEPGRYRIRIRWLGRFDQRGETGPTEAVMQSDLQWASISAEQDAEDVVVSWTSATEYGTRELVLEAAAGDGPFEPLESFEAAGTSDEPTTYTQRIPEPGTGSYRYHVTWTGTDDRQGQSPEAEVTVGSTVTFVETNAAFIDSKVVLDWQTRDEIYLSGYTVEMQQGDGPFEELEALTPSPSPDSLHTYTFTRERLDSDLYRFRIRWEGQDDGEGFSPVVETRVIHPIRLDPVFPNPARVRATLRYSLERASGVRLQVLDLLGRQVLTLDAGDRPAGPHEMQVPVQGLAAGVYQVRLLINDDELLQGRFVVRR